MVIDSAPPAGIWRNSALIKLHNVYKLCSDIQHNWAGERTDISIHAHLIQFYCNVLCGHLQS
jgi:hypothetical protein